MLRLTTFYYMYAINSFMAWDTYTSGAGTCYPSGAPEFIVCHCVLFLWSLNCLSFFLQLLLHLQRLFLKTSSTCINLRKPDRILGRPVIKSPNKTTPCRRKRHVSLYSKIQQTTRKFKIRIITLKRKIQNYLCVLILFIYMIF